MGQMMNHLPKSRAVRTTAAVILILVGLAPVLAVAETPPVCQYCGKPITGQYVVYDGKAYHQACYENNVAMRCSLCGSIIEGEYYLDPWGKPYHKEHADEIPMCRFCGRLISDPDAGGGRKFDDQYYICNHCQQDVVNDTEEAERLVAEIHGHLKDLGIDLGKTKVEFELVDRGELSKKTGKVDVDNFGLARQRTREYLLSFLNDEDYAIFVLTGLPRMYFISTATHELMHIWLYLHGAEDMEQQMVEGSCDVAGILVLEEYYDDVMIPLVTSQLLQSPDPIYGEGCRRVKRMVDNRGIEYWLEHLQFDPQFPIGY